MEFYVSPKAVSLKAACVAHLRKVRNEKDKQALQGLLVQALYDAASHSDWRLEHCAELCRKARFKGLAGRELRRAIAQLSWAVVH